MWRFFIWHKILRNLHLRCLLSSANKIRAIGNSIKSLHPVRTLKGGTSENSGPMLDSSPFAIPSFPNWPHLQSLPYTKWPPVPVMVTVWHSQSDDHPKRNLAKFWPHTKDKSKKIRILLYSWLPTRTYN